MLWAMGYFVFLIVVCLVWGYYIEKVYRDMENK